LTGVLCLPGCAVNQTAEIATYRQIVDANQPMLKGSFRTTEPLSLQRALILTNANSEEIALSGENYLQALIDKDRVFANFLPTIAFAPEYMRQEKADRVTRKTAPQDFLDLPVGAELNVNPLSDISNYSAADTNISVQKALLLNQRATILLDVAQTYYQVLRSEEESDVLGHSVEVQSKRVADIKARQQAGVARSLDVAQAEAQLAETCANHIQAQNDVKNGRAMLAFLIGVPAIDGVLADDFKTPKTDWTLASLMQQARISRQDLQAADAQVSRAAKNLDSAWGEYFPSVSLNLNQYLHRESYPSSIDWTGLLQVNVPIFSAGLIHADVRTAYSLLRSIC